MTRILPRSQCSPPSGFTLIELLVTITILAILTSGAVVFYGNARERAKRTAAQAEIHQFIKAVVAAQGKMGKTLTQITTSGCSGCSCWSGDDPAACQANWDLALAHVQDESQAFEGFEGMSTDPWGRPYLLDENESEGGPTDCRRDFIQSAGKDGVYVSYATISNECLSDTDPVGTPCTGPNLGDDVIIKIPFATMACQ